MSLGIGQDLHQETPGGGIPLAELAHEGGVRRHLLPFEHKIFNDHLSQRGALLGAHPHARRLRRNIDRAIEGDPPQLLNALGEQISMLGFFAPRLEKVYSSD